MRGFLAMFFVMLYAPIVTLIAFSFNRLKTQHRLARFHDQILRQSNGK